MHHLTLIHANLKAHIRVQATWQIGMLSGNVLNKYGSDDAQQVAAINTAI